MRAPNFQWYLSKTLPALLGASFWLAALNAGAQTPSASPKPQPGTVPPTVTADMGDPGGKYFGKIPDPAKTKHYYIAAEPVLWNFIPEGADPVCNKSIPPSLLLERNAWKIRYVQYADANFSARVLPAERLGIMGPVLRGTTGQYLAVTFLNRSWLPLSMHPHGVKYDKDSEGSYYQPAPGLGAAVAPGAKFTYVWYLDKSSAPLATEPSSKAWLYHSHVGGDEEVNMGLIGSIIVTDPARARADGTPKDVDREMAALFMIFDESGKLVGKADADDDPGANGAASSPTATASSGAAEDSQRHTINGLAFGNLNGLEMNEGERVRWYLFGLGSESDLHSAHWHGERVIENGSRQTDVVELLPGSMKVADMVADNPGNWLLHCHVAEHMAKGMFTRFTVYPYGSKGVSRDPENAFFGMPQSLQTLRFQDAELVLKKNDPGATEIDLSGQVTVPDPFPLALNAFSLQIGSKTLAMHPDRSGLCVSPEGVLLVKNASSIGVVTGGTLKFDLTLKGAAWRDELKNLNILTRDTLAPDASLHVELQLGNAQHIAAASLKAATP